MSTVRIRVDLKDEDSVSEVRNYLSQKYYTLMTKQIVVGTVESDGIHLVPLADKFSDIKDDSAYEYVDAIVEHLKTPEITFLGLIGPEDFVRIYFEDRELLDNENAYDAIGYYADFLQDIPETVELIGNTKEFDEVFDAWLKRHGLFLHKSMLAPVGQ